MKSKLSAQEKLDRYCMAKILAWRATLMGLGHDLQDPNVIPIPRPKTGAEELRERQATFREHVMSRCVVECDID